MGSVDQFVKNTVRLLHTLYLRKRCRVRPQINPHGKVLIVAPHPDDEVIGCGGLIARLVAEGRTPHIIVMTGGEGSHRGCCSIAADEIKTARRELTDKALRLLSVDREFIHYLDFPDGGIPSGMENGEWRMENLRKLEELLAEINPDTIFVPHWCEGWPDHVNTRNLILNSQFSIINSPQVWEYCVWMWYYNVWRGLEWKNAYKLKMTPREHQLKLEAMDAYIKPLAPCGKPWSGVLPELFVKANSSNTELYFRAR